jgi:hypothetical protein
MHKGTVVARKMSEARESEFAELSRFIEYYSTFFDGIPRDWEIHPSNVLVKIIAQFGRSKALEGLKQAVNDTIEGTRYLSASQLAETDLSLRSNGIVTLSALRLKYWSRYKKIVSRQIIKSETEYYLAVGILKDSPDTLTAEDYTLLTKMTNEFEQKHA